MPGFRKPQPELVERFDELASLVEADRKLIFGSPACVLHGNMFTALHDDYLILRLSEADRAEMTARHPDARVFEPMVGRPMKEYVVAPADLVASDEIEGWVRRSFAYAQTLPPKIAKKR